VTISGQQLGKHIPMAMNMHATIVTVGNGVFIRGPCRDVMSKGQSQLLVSSVQEAVKKRVSCKSPQLKVQL
jgi:hypothetical protein